MMSKRAVVLLSGGLNSFVAAKFVQTVGVEIVEAICFNYGQEHCDEIDYAAELAARLDVPFSSIQASMLWEMTDRLTHEQAAHMTQVGLNNSFWFGRRLAIHLLGASRAQALNAGMVVSGSTMARVSDGGAAIDFLQKAIDAEHFDVKIEVPFIGTELGHAFKVAHALDIFDEAVAMTYDCLHGSHDQHDWGRGCGECEGCLRRAEGHRVITGHLLESFNAKRAEVPS
jgi:7-cyano-7-deazaguanine synthase